MRACRYFRLKLILAATLMYLAVLSHSTAFAQNSVAQSRPKVEKPDRPERQVKVFRLKYLHPIVATSMVMDIWKDMDLRISADEESNFVVLSGDEKLLHSVEALLTRLDVEPDRSISRPEPDAHDVMIRVAWLVDERLIEGEGDAAAIAPDLIPTVEKLRAKFGLGNLVTAGQIIINQRVVDQQDFAGSGTALVQGTSEMGVIGNVKITAPNKAELVVFVRTGPVRIIEVGGSKRKAEDRAATNKFVKPMSELESKILVTIGQPVFFGMASIESKTSLFVIQVLDADSVTDEKAEKVK